MVELGEVTHLYVRCPFFNGHFGDLKIKEKKQSFPWLTTVFLIYFGGSHI